MLRWRQRRWTVTAMSFHPSHSLVCSRGSVGRLRGSTVTARRVPSLPEAVLRRCRVTVRTSLTISLPGLTELMRGDGHCQWGLTALQVHHQTLLMCWSKTSATHPQRCTQCRKERNAHQQPGMAFYRSRHLIGQGSTPRSPVRNSSLSTATAIDSPT